MKEITSSQSMPKEGLRHEAAHVLFILKAALRSIKKPAPDLKIAEKDLEESITRQEAFVRTLDNLGKDITK